MKIKNFFNVFLGTVLGISSCGWKNDKVITNSKPTTTKTSIYDFKMENIEGETISIKNFKGKVVLIVNVASKCGHTPQYKDLQDLYDKYKNKGLEILGFPANNFLSQEPGNNKQIHNFCQKNYGVTFNMFAKISVKGENIHPLYQYLTQKKHNKVFNSKVKWNFQKFLIDKEGILIASIGPAKKVIEKDIIKLIEKLLFK